MKIIVKKKKAKEIFKITQSFFVSKVHVSDLFSESY